MLRFECSLEMENSDNTIRRNIGPPLTNTKMVTADSSQLANFA